MTAWTSFELEVVTPLFSGDDPDATSTDSPVRVPSIRGALRYWFRAVAAGHGVVDLDELARQESEIFGSTRHPSPIRMRVRAAVVNGEPQPVTAGGVGSKPVWARSNHPATPRSGVRAGRNTNRFNGAQYLLGRGLWNYETGIVRPYVEPGARFNLDVRLSRDERINARFLLAMWAWLTYGGLGARARRGFGQLRCVSDFSDSGNPILAVLGRQRGTEEWEQLAEQAIPRALREQAQLDWSGWMDDEPEAGEAMPALPTLAPKWWRGDLLSDEFSSLKDALHHAGQEWRTFRAVKSSNETPTADTRSPEWKHAIHGKHDSRYPIAALGLPIGYFSPPYRSGFKGEIAPVMPGGKVLRRASPVWLRPVQVSKNNWRVFTHVFFSRLLPDEAELRGFGQAQGRELAVPDSATAEDQWDRWLFGKYRLRDNYYTAPPPNPERSAGGAD